LITFIANPIHPSIRENFSPPLTGGLYVTLLFALLELGRDYQEGAGANLYPLPSVGEDGGEGDKEQFTLSPTLSHPGRGKFIAPHFIDRSSSWSFRLFI
jgi:hypothetical protein